MVIGLTGKSGVGKTTLSKYLAEQLGYKHIAIDDLSHEVLCNPDVIQFVKDNLSTSVISDGKINRVLLGDLIFESRSKYRDFNNFLWAQIKVLIDEKLSLFNNSILDWILLPHSHYWKLCDVKILVQANEADRKFHVLQRDHISLDYLSKRDNAGISYDNINFDIVYTNNYSFDRSGFMLKLMDVL